MGLVIGGASRRTELRALASWIAVALCAAACTSGPDGVAPISDTNAPRTATSEQRDDRDAVVDAYAQFWPRLHEAASQPESQWAELMREVATDPQLSRTLEALRQQRAQARTLYGAEIPRVTDVEVSGERAIVKDCQDASQAGQADANTGDRKTVGVARNPVSAALALGADGKWRVSEISYPGGTC